MRMNRFAWQDLIESSNFKLREAYQSGRRQGLNEDAPPFQWPEQSPQFPHVPGGGGHSVTYWIQFITWLLSQGLITNEQFLEYYDMIVNGMSDLEVLILKFGRYLKQFDNPLPDDEDPIGPIGPPITPGGGGDGGVIDGYHGFEEQLHQTYQSGRRQGLNEQQQQLGGGAYVPGPKIEPPPHRPFPYGNEYYDPRDDDYETSPNFYELPGAYPDWEPRPSRPNYGPTPPNTPMSPYLFPGGFPGHITNPYGI